MLYYILFFLMSLILFYKGCDTGQIQEILTKFRFPIFVGILCLLCISFKNFITIVPNPSDFYVFIIAFAFLGIRYKPQNYHSFNFFHILLGAGGIVMVFVQTVAYFGNSLY